MKLILTILLILTIVGCKKHDITAEIGEEINLCFAESGVIIDNENQLDLEFINLVEDSRCPEGSQCIWAGRAIIELKINSTEILTLGLGDLMTGANPPLVNSVEFQDYILTLLAVSFNKKRQQGVKEKYQITLSVDKK